LSDFKEPRFFTTGRKNHSNIKFTENPSSCFMRTDGRTDMMKLTVSFRNSAKVPTNCNKLYARISERGDLCLPLFDNQQWSSERTLRLPKSLTADNN